MLRKRRCGLSGTAFIHMIWELDFFDHNLSVSNFLLKINLLQSSPKNNRVTLLFITGEKSTFALPNPESYPGDSHRKGHPGDSPVNY